jgi:hypothetical protein
MNNIFLLADALPVGIIFIEECKSNPLSVMTGAIFTILFYLTVKRFKNDSKSR